MYKKPNILLMNLKCSVNIYICWKNVIYKPGVLAVFFGILVVCILICIGGPNLKMNEMHT